MIKMTSIGEFVNDEIETTVVTSLNFEDVINRLMMLGYDPTTDDELELEFETIKVISYVLNYCNISQIPSILNPRILDRICSEYLFNKKNSGTLNGFNYDEVVREIKEGDTTVKYANGSGEDTPENRFDALVKQLERGFDKWLTPHRRLRW